MEYGKAEGIRKKGLAGLITDNLVEGQGIGSSFGSAISDRTKATFTGIQEKFDPLNIAKKLTGGSNLAPALLGRLMGRKQSTIEHFAKPRKRPSARGVNFETGGALEEGGEATKVLGMIYEELKMAEETRKSLAKARRNEDDANEERETQRNKAIIAALTVRKKKEEEDKKKRKKKEEVKEKPGAPTKPTPPGKGKGKGKKPAKEAPKEPAKEAPKPPTKEAPKPPVKEAPKPPAKEAEKPTAAPAPKPEVKPPSAAPAPKPEVKPSTTAPAPKPEVKPPTATPTAKPPIVGGAAGKLGGSAAIVISSLAAAGLSSKAQANVLAQVKSESNFVAKSENLNYSSAKAIQNTFGKNRIPSEEFAQQFVKNPEALANHVYAKTDGNSQPGDGWKYRGRGFLQITGKNAYKSLGDYLKMDLISNPDLLNSPEVAAKSIPWFFLNYKSYLTKGDPKSLENISLVNKAVGFSDPTGEKATKRAELALEFESQGLNTGNQINAASVENKDLKQTESDKNANIVNTTNVNQTNNTQQTNKKQKENDRPAILEKSKG
jgi:predicted chitinase